MPTGVTTSDNYMWTGG